ncbi:hypothetical protein [Roseivirga sp. E12]|uniref:hypothetical protein n=1 Tax=Roseivirga sp. E12 TaxID=2819237 RepID=UPI001ABCE1A0|nr:hypothetical protein [Roseivirga sp. E12]MBO3700789.1 hypothetical protein [Roseivirga sp. E12]
MKSRIHLKLLMAPLSMLAVLACSPDQYQQASEYDDVYFTSADRKTVPKIVAKPEQVQSANTENVITLSNQSKKSVDPTLLNRYNNNESKEVEYFVEGEGGPRVTRANELNYDDFVWDYENELLATYALPVDWAEEWDKRYFNNLISNDFEFRLAWYDQYYVGNSTRMDRYITASNGRIGRTSMSTFGGNGFRNNFWNRGINVSVGFGTGFGFYDPFFVGGGFGYDPFFDPFYDPFFFNTGFFGFNRWNRWNRGWGFRRGFGFGGGFGGGFYCPPIFSNQYIYRGEIIVGRNDRTYTRGGRLSSTSVANVRSDATNGVAQTRSQRLASASGTSRVSRSSIENRSSRTGRVSSSSVSRTSSSRSATSRNSSSQVANTRSSRVRTDAYRFNDSRSSGRSSSSRVGTSSTRGRSSAVTSRTSRSSRNSSTFSGGRSSNRSTSGRASGVSFNRNSSSRSSSGVSRSSSRSSSSRGVSRGSSRSSSSRSSGSVSRGSRSRSSGSVSRSSRSSGSSRSSSSSSRSSSSRSGRGN